MNDCIFCKIRDGEIKKEFTYQDDELMVFPDIHPLKPVHLLIVPKSHVEDFADVQNEVLKKVLDVVKMMIKEQSLNGKGYRLGVNGGGSQLVNHFHLHLMGPMGVQVKGV